MDHYPIDPGFIDQTTSRDAAEKIAPRARVLRGRIMLLFNTSRVGLTTHEVAAIMEEPVPSIQPRISELYATGHLARSGQRRQNASGMSAHVMVLGA